MLRELSLKWLVWTDGAWLKPLEIKEALWKHNFHELDIEACLEENQRVRIDSYKNYAFIILHFPKYYPKIKEYKLNEFNIFIGKDFLITLKDFSGTHIDKIFEKYSSVKLRNTKKKNINSGFVLYELIQVMLEKMFKTCDNIRRDIKRLEKQVFEKSTSPLVRDILIKKRNIVVLKHMLQPQIWVLRVLESHMNKIFDNKIEAYFEDLEDKIEKIITDISILEEYIESVEDAFKSMIDIQTNSIIKFLTIFSAFMLPLTLITSFYGMNIKLPYQESPVMIYIFMISSFLILLFAFLHFYWKRKI